MSKKPISTEEARNRTDALLIKIKNFQRAARELGEDMTAASFVGRDSAETTDGIHRLNNAVRAVLALAESPEQAFLVVLVISAHLADKSEKATNSLIKAFDDGSIEDLKREFGL